MRRFRSLAAFGATLLAACATLRGGGAGTATAIVRNAQGTELGVLRLDATVAGVRVSGLLTGLTPGAHGIHLHAVGRCDAPEFTTAGAHFNPANRKHGLVNPEGPHAGDLPALAADATGRATVNLVAPLVTLDAAQGSGLLDADGSSLVVHAANDDQRTDPAGNSGARLACGLVAAGAAP